MPSGLCKNPELEEKIAKEEVQKKMKLEKASKNQLNQREEQEEAREEARLLEEEIAKRSKNKDVRSF